MVIVIGVLFRCKGIGVGVTKSHQHVKGKSIEEGKPYL